MPGKLPPSTPCSCDLDGMDHIMSFIKVINLKLSNVLLNLELAIQGILTWYFLGPVEFKMNKEYVNYKSTKYK